jgi:hypothetical protein
MTNTTPRATAEAVAGRIDHAARLRAMRVPPTVAVRHLAETYGVSLRQATRYMAEAVQADDGPAAEGNIIDAALTMSASALAAAVVRAVEDGEHQHLPRLCRELRELKTAIRPGPSMSDEQLLERVAFEGGRDALGKRTGTELS